MVQLNKLHHIFYAYIFHIVLVLFGFSAYFCTIKDF